MSTSAYLTPTHQAGRSCNPNLDLTYLCAIDQDDPVRMESHSGQELQKLLKGVAIGLGEEQAQQPQGVATLGRVAQLWGTRN